MQGKFRRVQFLTVSHSPESWVIGIGSLALYVALSAQLIGRMQEESKSMPTMVSAIYCNHDYHSSL